MRLENFSLYVPYNMYNEIIQNNSSEDIKKIVEKYTKDDSKLTLNYIFKNKENENELKENISLGKLFLGNPEIDTYIKCTNGLDNAYLHPRDIKYGMEINIPKEEFLNNFNFTFNNNTLDCKGDLEVFANMAEYSLDLKKDNLGKAISLEYRKRKEEEIKQDITKKQAILPNGSVITMPGEITKKARLTKECLEFAEREKFAKGYFEEESENVSNTSKDSDTSYITNNIIANDEIKESENEKMGISKIIFQRLKSIKQKKVAENTDVQISRIIAEIENKKELNNPYIIYKYPSLDKKFVDNVEEIASKGQKQLKLSLVLETLATSNKYQYYIDKCYSIDKGPIKKNGIHGISHSERVALICMCILEYQDMLGSISNRELDILLSAAYYHDIGRIADIGAHSARSAKLIAKKAKMFKEFKIGYEDGREYTEDDLNFLMALVEGHEGTNEKSLSMSKKYNLNNNDTKLFKKLMYILKDADALDRVRTCSKYKADLNIAYLRYDASKRLIKASFEIETLSRSVTQFASILMYKYQVA